MNFNYLMLRIVQLFKKNVINSLSNVIIFLLITYFSFILIAFNYSIYQELNNHIKKIPITLVFSKDEDAYHTENIILNKKSIIKFDSISLITSNTGMLEFKMRFGNISGELLPDNPIPAIIHVFLKPDYLNKEKVYWLLKQMKEIQQINEIIYPQNDVLVLLNLREFFQIILLIFAAFLLFINVFFIINRALRELKNKAEEFALLSRLGSGKLFMVFPALFYNFSTGFFGILLGIAAGFLTIYFLQNYKYYDTVIISKLLILIGLIILLLKLLINLFILLLYRIKRII